MRKSSTNKPANWIADPAYGMALIASLQEAHPDMTLTAIAAQARLGRARLASINTGRRGMRFMEQLAIEALLPDETVAKLRSRYYTITPVETFWDHHLSKGESHARRQ